MVFPHGDAHILCNGSPPCIGDYGKHLKELFSQGVVLARYGGGGETTVFHCGFLVCDLELCKTFLGGLPPVFRVNIRNDPAGQWLENSIKFSAAEASANGRAAMRYWRGCLKRSLWKLSAVTWRTCRRSKQAGWQAREILRWERALAHMHRAPECPWTIASLAQQVGVSRSMLVERFRQYLGEPPITYLSRWRLQLGARMLTSTSFSVARISGDVGYESEPAFNRAFKREFGAPPARFRMRARLEQRAVRIT